MAVLPEGETQPNRGLGASERGQTHRVERLERRRVLGVVLGQERHELCKVDVRREVGPAEVRDDLSERIAATQLASGRAGDRSDESGALPHDYAIGASDLVDGDPLNVVLGRVQHLTAETVRGVRVI